MQLILQGILVGLTLAILLGPIFITITQASIEHGTKEGLSVCSGVWVSDILIIALTYLFVRRIAGVVESESFRLWMGIIGGLVLMSFGIGAYIKEMTFDTERKKLTIKSFSGFWLKGFLVNTINPFTFIFWIGIISSYIVTKKISDIDTMIFLGAIMVTIIITDASKVFAAKLLRQQLQDKHVNMFSKLAGVGLFVFGLFLIYRVVF